MHITKSELIELIIDKPNHLSPTDTKLAVGIILNTIFNGLVEGRRVEIRGFGCFSIRHREARASRNPATGAHVELGETFNIRFKPGKNLHKRIRFRYLHQ